MDLRGKEVTFLIKKSMSGRVGWKIMPEDDNLNLKINATILEQVMTRIRWEKLGHHKMHRRVSLGVGALFGPITQILKVFDQDTCYRDMQFSGEVVPSKMSIVIQ